MCLWEGRGKYMNTPTSRDRDNLQHLLRDITSTLRQVETAIKITNDQPELQEALAKHYVRGLCVKLNILTDITRIKS